MSLDLVLLRLSLAAVRVVRSVSTWLRRLAHRDPSGAEAGQATAEYALVLLGAAVVAIALVTWATRSGRIGQLFDAVFDELQDRL